VIEKALRAIAGRTGPILSDGTAMRSLIDLERRTVDPRVLVDPEIYEIELRKVFATSWIVVAHEAEIPNPWDFVTRRMGEDGVIVTRDGDGGVHILRNECAHRQMEVCRVEEGSRRTFTCPFHGWTFDNRGHFLGAPNQRVSPRPSGHSRDDLVTARTSTVGGMVIGCFDERTHIDATDLGAIGGATAATLRTSRDLSATPITRYQIGTNWKCLGARITGGGAAGLVHQVMVENAGVLRGIFPSSLVVTDTDTDTDTDTVTDTDTDTDTESVAGVGDRIIAVGGLVPKGPSAVELWTIRLATKAIPPAPVDPEPRATIARHLSEMRDDRALLGEGGPLEDAVWQWWVRWFDLMTAE
jgi:nitrite reductase/ring-hydroxylating ferredoxin subunit